MYLYGFINFEFMIAFTIIINFIFTVIILGGFGIWIYLFLFLRKSLKFSPVIPTDFASNESMELVSVIIPARNEERYIGKCISSILNQTYPNYEVIVVNDSSSDRTVENLESFKHDSKLRIIDAGEKPENWVGKNWPCHIGYKNSKGKYLLFTDADTIHNNKSIENSVNTLMSENLDVLTAVPNLIYPTFIIKMVLPILSIFMFSRYSPMQVNDPKLKLGYLFGSFFVISRQIYEKIGTHESVKNEIVEDGALGKKIKEKGYRLKMFRGENLLNAYWARDFHTLWNSLKRLIVPLYFTDKKNSILIAVGIFLLMMFPFIVFIYSLSLIYLNIVGLYASIITLFVSTIFCILAIFATNFYQLKKAGTHNPLYFAGTPIGCFIVSTSFLWSIASSKKEGVVKWRDRVYRYKN